MNPSPTTPPVGTPWSPCTEEFPLSYLKSSTLPRNRRDQHSRPCSFHAVVELGYSTHLPHPERMRSKTRLPCPKSEQPRRKRAVQKQAAQSAISVSQHSLISARAEVCAGAPHCTSHIPRGAPCTGNPACQETATPWSLPTTWSLSMVLSRKGGLHSPRQSSVSLLDQLLPAI